MSSHKITNTTGRVKQAWTKMNELTIKDETNKKIREEVDKSKIHLGELTKFYPYLDKAEVIIKDKAIVCKVLHRLGGSLIDFFTPEGEASFCNNLKEPCIIPREKLNGVILDVNDNSKEWLLLGFYIKEDIVFNTPADNGYFKIADIGATNNWGISIGEGNVKVSTNEGISFKEGEFAGDSKTIEYSSANMVYTKDEVYSKDEVNAIIDDLRKELKGES